MEYVGHQNTLKNMIRYQSTEPYVNSYFTLEMYDLF